MSNAEPRRIIEAEEFVLRGKNGEVQARIHATDRGPEISLFDVKGRKRTSLYVASHVTGIRLFDRNGKGRIQAAILHNGPVLWLSNGKGKQRAVLAVGEDSAHLTLYGSNGLPGVSLSLQKDGPRISLTDASGNAVCLTHAVSTQSRKKEVTKSDDDEGAGHEIA